MTKKTYEIKFSFTQTVEGTVKAESVSEVYEGLTKDFSDAPDFRILTVKEVEEPEQLELALIEVNEEGEK